MTDERVAAIEATLTQLDRAISSEDPTRVVDELERERR